VLFSNEEESDFKNVIRDITKVDPQVRLSAELRARNATENEVEFTCRYLRQLDRLDDGSIGIGGLFAVLVYGGYRVLVFGGSVAKLPQIWILVLLSAIAFVVALPFSVYSSMRRDGIERVLALCKPSSLLLAALKNYPTSALDSAGRARASYVLQNSLQAALVVLAKDDHRIDTVEFALGAENVIRLSLQSRFWRSETSSVVSKLIDLLKHSNSEEARRVLERLAKMKPRTEAQRMAFQNLLTN